MAELGYDITFYPVFPSGAEGDDPYRDISERITLMEPGGAEGFRKIVRAGAGRFDMLWVSRPHNIDMVCQVLSDAGMSVRTFVRSRVVFDSEAIFAMRDFIAALMPSGAGFGTTLMRDVRQETRNFRQADHVVTVSEAESRLLAACGITNTSKLGHAMEPRMDEAPSFARRGDFIFIGSLAQEGQPNVDSLDWLLQEAWPALERRLPGATLTIVGEVAPEIRARLSRPGIDVVGRVADPSPYFDRARVCIAPTRFAAGVPHKVYEAIMRGVPVVLTPLLAQQVGWPEGTGYLVRDWRDPQAFADALYDLHQDGPLWQQVRDSGRDQVARDCDPQRYRADLKRLCEAPTA